MPNPKLNMLLHPMKKTAVMLPIALITGLTVSATALAEPFNNREPNYAAVDTHHTAKAITVPNGYANRGVDVISTLSPSPRAMEPQVAHVPQGFNDEGPWRGPVA